MTRRGLWMAVLLVAGAAAAAADDLDTTYQNLKDAVTKKDAVQVKKLATEACALARKEVSAPAPEGTEEEAVKQRVAYVRDIEGYTEYALFATAVQSEPATMLDLLVTLEQQNPKSKYLDQAYGSYLMALTKTGAAAKVPDTAEKALVNFPENEDLLLVVADTAWTRKQTDRALVYANRIISVLSKHPKPEGIAAADWERKRSASLGRAYWMAGIINGDKGKYVDADRNLRAALPLIRGNDNMTAPALYSLGIANYQLGKMTNAKAKVLEGAKFCEESGTIQWAKAHDAWRDAQVMKKEAGAMR